MQPNDKCDSPAEPKEGGTHRGKGKFTDLLLFGLTVLLIISILVNAWFYRVFRQFAAQARFTRIDLLSEQEFAPANAALTPPEPGCVRIVFAGDSDIELWDPLPEVKDSQIIRRGCGGERSGDLLVRLERDVVELKPAIAVLTVGGNDMEDVGLVPEQEDAIVAICERNIRVMVDRLRQKQIHVVLLTISPYGDSGLMQLSAWTKALYRAVGRVNARLRTLKESGLTVIDCDPILAGANGRKKPIYAADMMHLNTAGYQALNEVLQPVLESLVKKAKP